MKQSKINVIIGNDNIANNKQLDLKQQIDNIINQVGISEHFKGYEFIREAVELAVNDMDILSAVGKELYPEIAKKFNTTPRCVERSIRYAIKISWARGEVNINNKVLRSVLKYSKRWPPSKKFIFKLAQSIVENN